MKNMYLIIILLLVMSFLLFPLLAVKINTDNQVLGTSSEVKSQNQSYKTDNLNELKLYLKDEEKTVTLSKEEYLLGVLAAEMSADNHIEALKAQALVAFTYAYHKHIQNKNSGNDYDLTNDTTLDQGYLDKKSREAKWGEKYSQNEEKIIKLIKEIDKEIETVSNKWKVDRMDKVDKAILRLAYYEIKMDDDVPDKVAVNEAVELSKKYSSDASPKFINGILSNFVSE